MRIESNIEKMLGYPDGLDDMLNESQASKILAVIDRLTKAKKTSDIEAVIKMLMGMVKG
jgi:hypothetical protein